MMCNCDLLRDYHAAVDLVGFSDIDLLKMNVSFLRIPMIIPHVIGTCRK
jgi:hypothetical protein